jgi:transaldolase / glucose-6-phosphate isomerase
MTDLNGDREALGEVGAAVEARLAAWQREDFGRRLWDRDHTLWSPVPVPELEDRLGWLYLPETETAAVAGFSQFGAAVRAEGLAHAVVLGMGGSSLAPEVFERTFKREGAGGGRLEVAVLDSTHPDAVAALAARIDPLRSLFLVSSKSGGTIETLSFFRAFWDRVKRALAQGGKDDGPAVTEATGRHFAAITDPGSSLEALARERAFRAVFLAPPDVGGRYSAFTPFGLVPAALSGVDLAALLGRGREMAEACGLRVPAAENPGLRLGAALGELALAGRDKLTIWTSPALRSFPDWLEQLIAESTGKHGKGIVPVVGEEPGEPAVYGADRVFVALLLPGEKEVGARLDALEQAGHPVLRLQLRDELDLGREIFRWEVAVAAAGAVLGIHPFDQPDVQLAKELAGKALAAGEAAGGEKAVSAVDAGALRTALAGWLPDPADAARGDYFGLHAYLAPTAEVSAALSRLQTVLRDRTRLAATAGYGPRFLHSTGQLHKGGPGGRFLQLVDSPQADLPIPETATSFGVLIRAQAAGDRAALAQRGKPVLAVDLGSDVAGGLARLEEAIRA